MFQSRFIFLSCLRNKRNSLRLIASTNVRQREPLRSPSGCTKVSYVGRDAVVEPVPPETSDQARAREDEKHTQPETPSVPIPVPEGNEMTNGRSTKRRNKSRFNTAQRRSAQSHIPLRLLESVSASHFDLASFFAYAQRTGLKTTSSVYKGTHYEYIVSQALEAFQFNLQRTGRSNDLGIDLIGYWKLPSHVSSNKGTGHERTPDFELKVLVQCKIGKPRPAMVREMEGAYVGAPSGWRGDGVLGLLVVDKEATQGVRDAVQRSRWPIAFMQITDEGEVKQFCWNAVAARIGLEGLGITMQYDSRGFENGSDGIESNSKDEAGPRCRIALTWMNKIWRAPPAAT